MPLTKSSAQLVAEAMSQVTTYSVAQIRQRMEAGDPSLVLVDIRDIRELEKLGTIPGANHSPRGMLEFWVDPASPYHKPLFADESKEFVLFCGAGWRSALSAQTLQQMGMSHVAHMGGGYTEWQQSGAPVQAHQRPASS
jgi:rhodanese-related sulfurtransferase